MIVRAAGKLATMCPTCGKLVKNHKELREHQFAAHARTRGEANAARPENRSP